MTVSLQDNQSRSAEETVPAAKLQVLGLAPIKRKLGDKWDRLSDLVHKLFEKAIANAQGPNDHFITLDELSYVVTFGNLSLPQTKLMCASIAREVCEHLFGDKIDEVSVRTIIAEVIAPDQAIEAHPGAHLNALLERDGVETIHTHKVRPDIQPEPLRPPPAPAGASHPAPVAAMAEPISAAHALLAQKGLKLGLFPMWELKKGVCNSLFLTTFTGNGVSTLTTGTSRLLGAEGQIVDIEISHLYAAAAYAARMRAEKKVCALAVGVSYDTLGCFRSRIRYMAALQAAVFPSSNPLLVRIEQIPEGAPEGRIAEFAAMLTPKNVRVTLEFRSLACLRRVDIRLGATAMGGTLPANGDHVLAREMAERLVQKAMAQKAFSFLENLDSPEHLALANRANIRFGRGLALSTLHFSGLERVPAFPLVLARAGSVALV
jgi:hypothetical protein